MRGKGKRDILFSCLLVLLVGSLFYQSYQLVKPDVAKSDSSQMLFEVVHFQIQIMNSSLSDAIQANNTKELDRVKLTAYSAKFGHERLVNAFGKDNLEELSAISEFVNMITGWQIGGERPISQDEREILLTFASKFSEVVPIFGILVNNKNEIDDVQGKQLNKLNEQLLELLSK
ncbi:hypothetical protein [Paenibacillus sp. CMAA1364]